MVTVSSDNCLNQTSIGVELAIRESESNEPTPTFLGFGIRILWRRQVLDWRRCIRRD